MANKVPTVSVIIPTYNRAHLIGRAIQSVLRQTYRNLEVIVVDDGSTDNTEKVIKSFDDSCVHYIRHEKNCGGAVARNTGISAARGKFIAFQDSDDEWLSEKLEKQLEAFEKGSSELGVVYTGFLRMQGHSISYFPSKETQSAEGYIHRQILRKSFVGTPTALVRRDCLEKAGSFDVRLRRLQDWELWIRISRYYTFKFIEEPLVIAHCTNDSISTDRVALSEALTVILEKNSAEISQDRKLLAKHYCTIGHSLFLTGKVRSGRAYLWKAAKANPLNMKYLAVALVSLLGQGIYTELACLKRYYDAHRMPKGRSILFFL